MKRFNLRFFLIALITLIIFSVISFVYIVSENAGDLISFIIKLFPVFRFPFRAVILNGGFLTFVLKVLGNIIIYSFLLERLVSIFHKKK